MVKVYNRLESQLFEGFFPLRIYSCLAFPINFFSIPRWKSAVIRSKPYRWWFNLLTSDTTKFKLFSCYQFINCIRLWQWYCLWDVWSWNTKASKRWQFWNWLGGSSTGWRFDRSYRKTCEVWYDEYRRGTVYGTDYSRATRRFS
jgi:hypothetical protein